MQRHPKLRSDLESSKTPVGDEVLYTLKDPITGNYFRLREPEFWLISQLNGQNSPEDIAAAFRAKFNLNISVEDVRQFTNTIGDLFFLEDGRAEQQTSRTSYRGGRSKTLFGRLLYIQLKAFDPGRFLEWLTSIYRRFHNRFWFVAQALVLFIGLLLLLAHFSEFNVGRFEIFHVESLALIVLSLFTIIVFHEFAHAVMCRFLGGKVKEIGFLLMYFQPCFYADLSDAWLFPKKSHRLAVTWAGPYMQFIVIAVAVIIWRLTVPGMFINEYVRMIVIVGWLSFLINFNPLLKLDGYYLLSDWVDIPNLRRKAFGYFRNAVQRRLLGWPVTRIEATPREKRIFAAYSILALLYSGALLGYLFYLLARFLTTELGGFGLILLLILLFVIFQGSIAALSRGAVQHVVYMRKLTQNPVRLIAYLIVLAAMIVMLVAVPFPHHVNGEITVKPLAEYALAMDAQGFLQVNHERGGNSPRHESSVYRTIAADVAVVDVFPIVEDGQKVRKGDTLAVLLSSQVTHRLQQERAELDRLQQQMALLKAPPKPEEISELDAQVRAAEAGLEKLQNELRRAEGLAEKEMISSEELEGKRSAVDVARAELANKQSALGLLKSPPLPEEEQILVREIEKQASQIAFLVNQADKQTFIAPFDGEVSITQYDHRILTLTDRSRVELFVPVSDFELPEVEVGQQVKVKVRSYPGETYYGAVVRVPIASGDRHGHYPISVVVENTGGLLSKGMTGYAKIETGQASLVTLAYKKLLSNLRVEFWSWW